MATDDGSLKGVRGMLDGSPDVILSAAFRASRDALILFRADDELIIDVNEAWCATTGLRRDDVIGRSQRSLDIWRDADSARFAELMRSQGEVRDFRFSFKRRLPNGGMMVGHASLTAQPVTLDGTLFFLVAGRDMTAEVNADQQRQQSRRLEELGRLAGGVAHDFNNMLTVIGAYASMAHESVGAGELPLADDLREILRATEQATDLTRRLLAFSRHQVIEPRAVDLNAVIETELRMLARLIGEDVEVKTALSPGLPSILADPSQIAQVLMNLTLNARDAMRGGGSLEVRTGHVDCLPAMVDARDGALRSPGCVMLEVKDSGTGMTEEVRERMFEPFFTTKPLGHGTGLGLAMVYGIIRQAGGAIEVDTAPGEGTVFRLYWPLAQDTESTTPGETQARPWEGAGRVLLVEDDDAVRTAIARMLAERGFAVTQTRHGAEALERIVESGGERFDVVLTDVVMPTMGGRELAERLAAHVPGLPVVMMSGYSDRDDVRAGLPNVPGPVLAKPFELRMLVDALARARGVAAAIGPGEESPAGRP